MVPTLKSYRIKLKEHIDSSNTLVSISRLCPGKWLLSNHNNDDYRTSIYHKLYDNNEGNKNKHIRRLTIVESDKFFDEYLEGIITKNLKKHYECYLKENEIDRRIGDLAKKIDSFLEVRKTDILKETYAVFSSIHSSINDSLIIWEDKLREKGRYSALIDCLTVGDQEYHEVLIYDELILFALHTDHKDLDKNRKIDIFEIDDKDIRNEYLGMWERIFNLALTDGFGITIKDYIEKNIEKNFFRIYKDYKKFDDSLKGYIEKSFYKFRVEERDILRNKIITRLKELYEGNNNYSFSQSLTPLIKKIESVDIEILEILNPIMLEVRETKNINVIKKFMKK